MNPAQARELLARSWEQLHDGFVMAYNVRKGLSAHEGPATAAIMEAHRIGLCDAMADTRFHVAREFKRGRRRGLAIGFAVAYMFCGINVGMALKWAVPATSYAGVAYLAVIWPAWITQTQTGWQPPVPSWAFTFRENGK